MTKARLKVRRKPRPGVRPGVRPARAAFTLVEVLIAVLIIAIGILAIGSVIPVGVVLQRNASDAALGVSVVDSTRSMLSTRPEFNRLTVPGPSTGQAGWGVWLSDPTWSPSTGQDAFLWEMLEPSEFDKTTGRFELDAQGGTASDDAVLTVFDRLWPKTQDPQTAPQFVWDFVGRRIAPLPGQPAQLQLAVFVRRIDTGIVPRPGTTLLELLVEDLQDPNGTGKADRLPLGMVESSFQPTRDGTGVYASIQSLQVKGTVNSPRDRLVLTSTNKGLRQVASQPGQRLIDNLGNIYTVVGLVETTGNSTTITIDPPVPAWVRYPGGNTDEELSLRQVVFTPQIPAAVEVVTLTPRDPL
jgi:prepilin-type N-terminal cleavage/methylation domain-containing protein